MTGLPCLSLDRILDGDAFELIRPRALAKPSLEADLVGALRRSVMATAEWPTASSRSPERSRPAAPAMPRQTVASLRAGARAHPGPSPPER